jgi:glycosyltransferase involved in cell wall biosynthesis
MSDLVDEKGLSLLMLTTDRQIDRRTLQQADSLTNNGWQVTILAMPTEGHMDDEDPRIVRIEMNGRSLGFRNFSILSCYQKIRRHLPINGRLLRVLRRLAWFYLVNPKKLYSSLFANQLKRYTPTVVMAIDLPILPAAAMHARQCGAKLVYDSHELYCEQEFSNREKKQWRRIEETFIHQCHVVITINPSIALELKVRYDLENVHIIYNSINSKLEFLSHHLLHEALQLPLDKKILLFQGGLSKGRHLEILVHSMKYVKNRLIVLIILGDGQFRKVLERLVKSLNLNDRVYFHSAVPQKDLLAYSRTADAGIIPYQAICLNNYYCTPNKLFEFIAAGIPILGSNLPEINRIVLNNQLGLTGDISTTHQLAQLIDDFFSNPERLEIWKKNTLRTQSLFSWSNEEKKLLQIFRDIMK